MKSRQPNLDAVIFFLTVLDMEATHLNEFAEHLRSMDEWPQGVTPLHLAETLDGLLSGTADHINGARLAALGENF